MALWSVDNPLEWIWPSGLWIIPWSGYGLVICGLATSPDNMGWKIRPSAPPVCWMSL